MSQTIKLLLYLLIILYIFTSCANRKPPTGGPKDIEGPRIVKTNPEDKSLNFKERKLSFEFNEYVKEDNFTEKVIISPSIDSTFTYKLIKKKLTIEFQKDLKDSTTYTINLGEAIKDITESNSGIDLKLTFSTGNYLDSLDISGEVFDIQSGKGSENTLIGLYDAGDTLTIFNSKPKYISKSNKEGKFILENIHADSYLIYALLDKDKNLQYTNYTEPIGFLKDTIRLKSNLSKLKIPLQRFDLRKFKVNRKESKDDLVSIELNKGFTDFTIKLKEDSTKKLLYTWNKERNKIELYNTHNFTDSIQVRTIAKDSFDIRMDTTFKVKFEEKEESNKKSKKNKKEQDTKPFNITYDPSNNLILSTDEITFKFNYPIKTYKLDSFFFYLDTVTTIPIKEEEIKWNENRTELKINKKVPFKDTINLQLPYGSFINIQGDSNRIFKQQFKRKTSDKFSLIGGTVQISDPDFIVQLESNDGNQKYQQYNKKNFEFNYLDPGIYILKVFIDSNRNRIWDKGDLKKGIEPEKIIYYKIADTKGKLTNEINIKANWEIKDNVVSDGE
jgi:hypothetical protein